MPSGWTQPEDADASWHVAFEGQDVLNTMQTGGTNTFAAEGMAYLESDKIYDGQKAAIQFTGDFSEGEISFALKTSCEGDDEIEERNDLLCFYIDDRRVGRWSFAQYDWRNASFPISAGSHVLTWSYEKNAKMSHFKDRAWIDDVKLPLVNPHQTN